MIENKRNEKKVNKEVIEESLKKQLHQKRNLAAAQESRWKKKEEKQTYIKLLTQVKEFCLSLKTQSELATLILSKIQ